MNNLPKRVHVIGVCGVATSALAIAFKEAGVEVTGNDKGFFPPVSTELEKHHIDFYAGWHPEKMFGGRDLGTERTGDDIVIIGTASGSQNPETALAKELKIPSYSFAEAIGRFFAKNKSIVCAGTWGKTSSSAMLSHILIRSGLDPTYMFGGVSLSHGSSAKLTESDWSVFEGDEYKSSPTDPTAKFFYYKPTHLLLSAVSWDHADLYPTEKSYFDVFGKLLGQIPEYGFVVACADNEGVKKTLSPFKGKIIYYGRELHEDYGYSYSEVKQSADGLEFTISHAGKKYRIKSSLLGSFQAENITGCLAMAHQLGIEPEKITGAIESFGGLKRRMERRSETPCSVIDDIAHSPEKATPVLETLRSIYPGKVICVFEPNSGGRSRESAHKYDNAFKSADMVIIPRLTKLKVGQDDDDKPMEGDELAAVISKTHPNTLYIEDDKKLVNTIKNQREKGDVIAFLGSHGFRGMIEETVSPIFPHQQRQF